MAKTADQEAEELRGALDKLQEVLEIANENGLLSSDSQNYEKIIDYITMALQSLSNEDPKWIKARKEYSLAYHYFNRSVNSRSFWWRFKFAFGGPALVYLVTLSIFIFLAWFFFSTNISNSDIMWVPSWAYLWGAIGGILQGFWFLWQHVYKRIFRKFWFMWYLLLPLMGAILGALTYLVFFAGFIAATGEAQIQSESLVMLLSALAGFSTGWAVSLLDKLTEIIKIG